GWCFEGGVRMAKVGETVEVAGRKVGDPRRRGTVTGVRGAMIQVRWESGEETALIPGPGTLTVIGAPGASEPERTRKKVPSAKASSKTRAKGSGAKPTASR